MKQTKILISICIILLTLTIFSGCIEESSVQQKDLLENIDDNGLVAYFRFDEQEWTWEENEIIDSSGNNNHGTLFETTQIQPGKIGSGHIFLDGVDDYIIVKNSESLQPQEITVESWVKKSWSEPFEYLLSKGARLCDYSSYALYTDSNGGLSFYVTDETNTLKSPNVNSSIWDGNWHHIAGSFDGSICRLYIDGKEIESGNEQNISINYNLSTQNDLYIGTYNGSCFYPFNGEVDELFIWNRALNQAEIQDHFQLGQEIGLLVDETATSLSGLKEKIRLELSGLSYSDLVLIKGSDLSIQEELLMFFAQQQIPDLDKIETVYDTEISDISAFASSYEKLIFLGGNRTNQIISSLQSSGALQIEETYRSNPFVASFASSSSFDANFVIFSTGLEASNLENNGPTRSPLSQIMDKRLTPIVATIASITIIHIANLFGSTISEFFFDYTSEKLGERKKKKHQFKKEKKSSTAIRMGKEIASIIIAIVIFSISLSWTWSTNFSHFYSLLIINFFVVSFFYLIREGLRVYYSRKYKLNTEHVFWPLGSFLTFLSTLLGNTFSLASYTALENEEKEKRYSRMYFSIFSILFGLTLLAFIINIFIGSQVIQMFYVFTIMAVFIDMTPIKPLDGYEVKKFNLKRWILLYIPVFIIYIIIMFQTIL